MQPAYKNRELKICKFSSYLTINSKIMWFFVWGFHRMCSQATPQHLPLSLWTLHNQPFIILLCLSFANKSLVNVVKGTKWCMQHKCLENMGSVSKQFYGPANCSATTATHVQNRPQLCSLAASARVLLAILIKRFWEYHWSQNNVCKHL